MADPTRRHSFAIASAAMLVLPLVGCGTTVPPTGPFAADGVWINFGGTPILWDIEDWVQAHRT
jgi:hypothetical protein